MWLLQRLQCLTLPYSIDRKMETNCRRGDPFGGLMTDLSKAFDCLSHELLTAKRDAFDFDKMSLKLVHKYLSNLPTYLKKE